MSTEATKIIRLDDRPAWKIWDKGPYAEFYTELRHGTQKAIGAAIRPFAKGKDGAEAPKIVVGGDGKAEVKGGYVVELPIDKFDPDLINDLLILGQVKSWSLGPINQVTIDGLPEETYKKLVAAVDELYGGQGPLT
jgi:hypothetical protein